jgi:hypothetical protein
MEGVCVVMLDLLSETLSHMAITALRVGSQNGLLLMGLGQNVVSSIFCN